MPASTHSSMAASAITELDEPVVPPPDGVADQASADQALAAELKAGRAELLVGYYFKRLNLI